MQTPSCRIINVGEVSSWGMQFLEKLKDENIIEITFQPQVQKLPKERTSGNRIPVVFIENTSDSRKIIQTFRSNQIQGLLIWYGKGFTKDDLIFAIEKRVYLVFDNARPDDPKVRTGIEAAAKAAEKQLEFEKVTQALKTSLIQGDDDQHLKQILSELKIAVSKLEKHHQENEFISEHRENKQGPKQGIPFYKSQDFGDAISTVHDLERTGVLIVAGSLPEQEGKIEFLQGKIVSAQTGRVRGLKAIYRMFLWDQPKYIFTRKYPEDFYLIEDINISLKYICMEGENFRQRFNSIRRELPPGNLVLEIEPEALHAGTQLARNDFSTLASVVEFGMVSHVLDYTPLPDVQLYESLILLKRTNIIRVAS